MSEDRERWAQTVRDAAPEFGVVANVAQPDRFLRMGAKAWLVNRHGDGRCEWYAMSRGGRMVRAWKATSYFNNFRAAWIPPTVLDVYVNGTRDQMEALAASLNASTPEKPKRKG